MIRNFAILKLRSDARPDQVDALVAAMQHVSVKGMSGLIVHRDAALRPGNCDVLVVCDLEDEEACDLPSSQPLEPLGALRRRWPSRICAEVGVLSI
jgi:hypothetical protein